MIIFEGPDGAGKTTLIKKISEMYDLPVAPRVVGTDTQPLVDLRQWVEDNLAADRYKLLSANTIFDRHRLISEPIYSLAMGGDRDDRFWDLHWLRISMDKFYACEPLIVWCLPPIDEVIRNCEDESNRFVRPFIQKIYRGYMTEIARWGACQYSWQLTYDYKNHDLSSWLTEFDLTYEYWRKR